MKQIFILAAAMLLCLSTAAVAQEQPQEPQRSPEEMMQKKAERMSSELLLSDEISAKFIPLYVEFLKASKAIKTKYRPKKEKGADGQPVKLNDAQIEEQLRAQFSQSQETLDLRKVYFEKYLKILSPRQIRELYKTEQEQMNRHFQKQNGKPGGQHPAQPEK